MIYVHILNALFISLVCFMVVTDNTTRHPHPKLIKLSSVLLISLMGVGISAIAEIIARLLVGGFCGR